jgi:hypothetical protein
MLPRQAIARAREHLYFNTTTYTCGEVRGEAPGDAHGFEGDGIVIGAGVGRSLPALGPAPWGACSRHPGIAAAGACRHDDAERTHRQA